MKVYYENPLKEIKEIVRRKAKYQKVMLLFDDTVPSVELSKIHEEIKEDCIYNQINIKNIENGEIYNGYRLIIYRCEVDNFLKFCFNNEEFINVFYPKDCGMLPYFLSEQNHLSNAENYLVLDNAKVDLCMITSVHFNMFYNYFKDLLTGNNSLVHFNFNDKEITQFNVLNCVNEMEKRVHFVDIEILKKCDLTYEEIVLVDLLLIDAFLLLITGIKNQNLMLVDVYKSAKEEISLIDKFYRLYHNEMFLKMIILNYNCLYNYCLKTKQKIMDFMAFMDFETTSVNRVIEKIKLFAKNDNEIIVYLYLFNIFNE